jgi:hypothetical protein
MKKNKDPSLLIFLLLFIFYYLNTDAQDININNNPVIVIPDAIPETEKQINFLEIPQYRKINEKSIYADVLSRSKEKPYGDQYGRDNNVHETLHGIHAELRNQYFLDFKKRMFFLYYDNGLSISLNIPSIKIQNIIPYIPIDLVGKRYNLYFKEQIQYWNDQPLYILDEWVCYILGGEVAVQDYHNNIKYKEKSDSVSGCLEFSIYAVCLYNAVKNNNIEYFNKQPNFKHIIHTYLIKAEKVFLSGQNIFPSQNQDKLINNLKNNKSLEDFRKTLIDDFGGVFLVPVLNR